MISWLGTMHPIMAASEPRTASPIHGTDTDSAAADNHCNTAQSLSPHTEPVVSAPHLRQNRFSRRENGQLHWQSELHALLHLVPAGQPSARGPVVQPENSKRAHLTALALPNTTKKPREDTVREKKERNWWWETEKKREIVGSPPFGPPTNPSDPTTRPPPDRPPPQHLHNEHPTTPPKNKIGQIRPNKVGQCGQSILANCGPGQMPTGEVQRDVQRLSELAMCGRQAKAEHEQRCRHAGEGRDGERGRGWPWQEQTIYKMFCRPKALVQPLSHGVQSFEHCCKQICSFG